jgi:hypothetical protein
VVGRSIHGLGLAHDYRLTNMSAQGDLVLDMIDRLRRIPKVRVGERPKSWTVRIHKPPVYDFELDIPKLDDALEWWVTVRHHTMETEMWQDWMDYAGYVPKAEENKVQLAAEMCNDIEWFVPTLLRASDFRVVIERFWVFFRMPIGEWHLDGDWRRIRMYEASSAP